jgi:predicted metalloprotease with PDZ domain
MWFSEGLASYYQNLLQARQGVFSEQQMWDRLHAGFMRGRTRNKRPQLSLAELSEQMHETGSYMRVYWSGALYFLAADVELRRRSNNQQSLDTALEQLNRCCAEQQLSARDIARQLDKVSGQELFLPLFIEVSSSYAVPEFETLFNKLGVEVVGDTVLLRDSAEELAIREGIGRQM